MDSAETDLLGKWQQDYDKRYQDYARKPLRHMPSLERLIARCFLSETDKSLPQDRAYAKAEFEASKRLADMFNIVWCTNIFGYALERLHGKRISTGSLTIAQVAQVFVDNNLANSIDGVKEILDAVNGKYSSGIVYVIRTAEEIRSIIFEKHTGNDNKEQIVVRYERQYIGY